MRTNTTVSCCRDSGVRCRGADTPAGASGEDTAPASRAGTRPHCSGQQLRLQLPRVQAHEEAKDRAAGRSRSQILFTLKNSTFTHEHVVHINVVHKFKEQVALFALRSILTTY